MMQAPVIRIFGYGSLMNEKNLVKRAPSGRRVRWATLAGYEGVFAKPGNTHVYLTIAKKAGEQVFGALVDVDPPGLAALTKNEPGYELVDVTASVVETDGKEYPPTEPRVYSYIAPVATRIRGDLAYIRRSYIEKCTVELPPPIRERWLAKLVTIPKGVKIDDD